MNEVHGRVHGFDAVVPDALHEERVDRAVSTLTGISRREADALIAQGAVRVEGSVVSVRSQRLVRGQRLSVIGGMITRHLPSSDPAVVFDVVYEDPDVIVVDKPAGLVVHHGAGNKSGTLVDGLLARYPELARLAGKEAGDPTRPGIVHRLDKQTSGLLIVARSERAYRSLARQFREHTASRRYQALVVGRVESDQGLIDAPIGRSLRRPTQMTVSGRGKQARTSYRTLARYSAPQALTLLELTLETGRTHQVRVHLAAVGHPVVGDDRYSAPAPSIGSARLLVGGRVFLHACELSVEHPQRGPMSWRSPLPAELSALLDRLS